jgi:dTDP-glucose 4,6-dehydratase
VYNVGGGEELPNLKVIDTLCAVVDKAFATDSSLAARFTDAPAAKGIATSSLKTYVKDRPGHDRRYAIDETKIRSELGYHASMSFEEGLNKTVNWYLSNEAWWRAVMDGSYRQWLEKNYAG